jgi:hypothetical protein
MTHERFDRKVYVSKRDFTSSLAKWLVRQSPYVVPDNLSGCIIFFEGRLDELAAFDNVGFAHIHLNDLRPKLDEILESIPMIMALNEKKNKDIQGITEDPDSDFIDIGAVAGNIVCDFAEREDAQCWLDRTHQSPV